MRLRFVCPGRVLDVPVGRGVLSIYIGLLFSLYPIPAQEHFITPVLIHACHHTVSTPPCFHLKRCVGCTLFSYCLVAAAILRFLGLSAMTPESESFTKLPPTLLTALLHVTHKPSSHSASSFERGHHFGPPCSLENSSPTLGKSPRTPRSH